MKGDNHRRVYPMAQLQLLWKLDQGLEISANGSENVTIYQAKWVCLQ